MNAGEPRVRHRGLFLSPDPDEPETTEQEAPEGLTVRPRRFRPRARRHIAGATHHSTGNRYAGSRIGLQTHERGSYSRRRRQAAIRSTSATGSHQPSHSRR